MASRRISFLATPRRRSIMRRARGRAITAAVTVAATMLGVTASVTTVALVAPGAAQAATPPATVVLVHGVRGLVADIYVDGRLALASFQPVRSTDPIQLPAGAHVVDVRSAGAAASATPILHTTVVLVGGVRQSAVVHLDSKGRPALTVYRDDVSKVPAGQARLVVRHVAAAGPLRVLVDGRAAGATLTNTRQTEQLVAPGAHRLDVTGVGAATDLTPPQELTYPEGSATFMYLIGSQGDGTLGWAVVSIPGLQTPPTRIQTGDGSLTAPAGSHRLVVGGSLALAAMLLAVVAWRTPRSRPRRA
jgi:hypothetical protein